MSRSVSGRTILVLGSCIVTLIGTWRRTLLSNSKSLYESSDILYSCIHRGLAVVFAEDTKDTAAADPTTGKFGLSERDKIPI